MWFYKLTLSLCLLVISVPAAATAQSESLEALPDDGVVVLGRVTDRSTGEPVGSARVALEWVGEESQPGWEGTSGPSGSFLTPHLHVGDYRVRVELIGFTTILQVVTLGERGDVDLRIELVPEAVLLEPIVVAVRRRTRLETSGFYDRRNRGIGYFITRVEIEERGASRVADLFYRVPGARVVPGTGIRATPTVHLRGGCIPVIVLDATPLTMPARLDDLVGVGDVEAIEVYHGASAPIQYSRFTNCGTILVWTREPGVREARPLSWRRMLAAGGLAGAIFLLSR